jgi:hypothetical protein
MCSTCGCIDANGNETAVTISIPVRVAPGQDASIIAGFDQPTPYGKGK